MHKLVVIAALLAAAAPVARAQAPSPPTLTRSEPPPVAAPRDAGGWLARSYVEQERGDNRAARASLDEALKLQPDFPLARLTRAMVLSDLKETDAAIADIDALGAFTPPDQILRMKIDIFRTGGRYREAIDAGKALVALKPDSADAYRRLGHARQASENEAEGKAALADYDKALKLDPDMLKVYALRGEILSARRDVKGVERNYQAWLAKAPDSADAHAAYADALRRVGKPDKAKVEIDRALELKPSAQAYLARAEMTPDDQRDAALADIDKALALEPKSSFTYVARARMRGRWKQPDLAMADAEKALELWPENFAARLIRYQLNQDSGHYDLAIKDLDNLIARRPDEAMLLNNRCWTRALANRELDLALADCEVSLKIARNPATLDSRAFVKLRKGDLAGSIADYDAALKLAPDQAASLFGRGLAKRRSGATAAGDADLAAARKIAPEIDKRFAGYGVTP
uniref:Tetratricopeptide TPR_2 repeat protein n=1 Tax=Caulobacter sp. (strain K31) TaxID=366602 RepID=B0T2F8_CAUSK